MGPQPERRFDAAPPLGLYVHLPWCVRKCPYCDFNSHAVRGAIPEQAYVDALLADLDAERVRLADERPLISIFIGGGTPSLFSGDAVRRLLDGVRRWFVLESEAEITLEANPGAVDAEHFVGYAEAGVNRLSIGVQSLSDEALKRLGRVHTADDARRAVDAARLAGISNVNLDLMFALPGQMLEAARDDIEQLLALAPTHISYYELTLEPNTPFYQQPPEQPDHDLADAIQQQGFALLKAAGFGRYEVSAFAQAGRRCRHNLNYWRFGDYLGIGAGAHGKLSFPGSHIQRRSKQRQPAAFMAAAAQGAIALEGEIARDELAVEFFLNTLRLTAGVPAGLFESRTGLALDAIERPLTRARELGLMLDDPTRLQPSAHGQRYLNDLLVLFEPD